MSDEFEIEDRRTKIKRETMNILEERMQEKWRIIKEFPLFEVNNLGRVRRIKTGRLLKIRMDKGKGAGSYIVRICVENKQYYRSVAKLVAEAFIGEMPNPNSIVMYKDHDRSNFNVENLYWAERSQAADTLETQKRMTVQANSNAQAIAEGRMPSRQYNWIQPLAAIDIETNEVVAVFCGVVMASKFVGVHYARIIDAIKRQGTSAGYKWRRLNKHEWQLNLDSP